MRGACSPSDGATTHESPKNQEEIVICSQSYDPVCAENGITYSNDCIASINNVEIRHKGVCVETQTKGTLEEIESVIATTVITKDKPDWLDLVIDLIKVESAKSPKSYIDKCAYSGEAIYYQFTGGDSSPSILYNKDGQLICYPSNDLGGECPSYFNYKDRSRSCKRIWTDDR